MTNLSRSPFSHGPRILLALGVCLPVLAAVSCNHGPSSAGTKNIFFYDSSGKHVKNEEVAKTYGDIGVFLEDSGAVTICRPLDEDDDLSLSNCEPFVVRGGILRTPDARSSARRAIEFVPETKGAAATAAAKPIQVGVFWNSEGGKTAVWLCNGDFQTACSLQLQVQDGVKGKQGEQGKQGKQGKVAQHIAQFLFPKAPPQTSAGASTIMEPKGEKTASSGPAATSAATRKIPQVTILGEYAAENTGNDASAALTKFLAQARAASVPVLVDVSATWCGPCRSFAMSSLGLQFAPGGDGSVRPVIAPGGRVFVAGRNARVLVIETDLDFGDDMAAVSGLLGSGPISSVPVFFLFDGQGRLRSAQALPGDEGTLLGALESVK